MPQLAVTGLTKGANDALTSATTGTVVYGRVFHIRISGTFSGTIKLQELVDGASTYEDIYDGEDQASYTAPVEKVFDLGVATAIRCNVTAYTSGTINCRIRACGEHAY